MSEGIHVRIKYRDEVCFEQQFRAISGDTIVLRVDDLIEQKIQEEREACAKVCEAEGERVDAAWVSCAYAIRARGQG